MSRVGMSQTLGWGRILQLGLVQVAIGAVVVLMTSTLNRVLVVELGLPASVPGVLVALHFVVQLTRAHVGHASDGARSRTRWIVGGMFVLALAGAAAAASVALVERSVWLGLAAATAAFVTLGLGVSASGTALLSLVAERVAPERRARAVAILWVMMIAGIAVTAGLAGAALEPFSMARLVAVCATVCAAAMAVTLLGVWGVEQSVGRPVGARRAAATSFGEAFREVWTEPRTRRFAFFVFASMLAYSAQDLVLEPFAGTIFGLTPGESTKVGGMQHGAILVGMLAAALLSARQAALRLLAVGGCAASALALVAIAQSGFLGSATMFTGAVIVLGVANGVYAVGALGSMVTFTGGDADPRAGLRIGVFGAAQAVAYAAGGLLGAMGSDVARWATGSAAAGYGTVFGVEAALFAASAVLALRSAPSTVVRTALRSESDAVLGAFG